MLNATRLSGETIYDGATRLPNGDILTAVWLVRRDGEPIAIKSTGMGRYSGSTTYVLWVAQGVEWVP